MFNITRKSDPNYNAIVQSLAEARVIEQFDYNSLGQAYNGLDVGEIVDFPFKRDKQTSLIQQLQRRELTRNVDYRIVFDAAETGDVAKDAAGNDLLNEDGTPQMETIPTAFITRITTKEATMVVKTRGKRGEDDGGADLTDEAIPPSGTATHTVTHDAPPASPVASLGAPATPKTTTAPTKAPAKAPAKGAAPPKPAGKR